VWGPPVAPRFACCFTSPLAFPFLRANQTHAAGTCRAERASAIVRLSCSSKSMPCRPKDLTVHLAARRRELPVVDAWKEGEVGEPRGGTVGGALHSGKVYSVSILVFVGPGVPYKTNIARSFIQLVHHVCCLSGGFMARKMLAEVAGDGLHGPLRAGPPCIEPSFVRLTLC
jgi:hypothetical protein